MLEVLRRLDLLEPVLALELLESLALLPLLELPVSLGYLRLLELPSLRRSSAPSKLLLEISALLAMPKSSALAEAKSHERETIPLV